MNVSLSSRFDASRLHFLTNSIGGFLDHDGGSQGPTSPAKSKSLAQSIVPVTIKEILELQVSMSGDGFTIQTEDVSLDVGNVSFF